MSAQLSIRSLKEVRNLLYPIRRKWYNIGIELDIEIEELETINTMYRDPGECLIGVLKIWLKSINPTWEALGNALRAKSVNELQLAATGMCIDYVLNYSLKYGPSRVDIIPATTLLEWLLKG